jgi:hypothetical protein
MYAGGTLSRADTVQDDCSIRGPEGRSKTGGGRRNAHLDAAAQQKSGVSSEMK